MFSLCIPTVDRYEKFLSKNLSKYIENDLIEEIIIQDENGNDIEKIKNSNLNLEKVKLYKNEEILGAFKNKLSVCKKATNQWIALIDSDNFADYDYFERAKNYLEQKVSEKSILAPSLGKPNLNYIKFENKIYKKKDLKPLKNDSLFHSVMNTGNYIINKYLVDNLNLEGEMNNIEKYKFSPYDVIYLNTLLYEQFDLELHLVKDLHYTHEVHAESLYSMNNKRFKNFNFIIHKRFKDLK